MHPILPNIAIAILCLQETFGFILGIKHNPYRLIFACNQVSLCVHKNLVEGNALKMTLHSEMHCNISCN